MKCHVCVFAACVFLAAGLLFAGEKSVVAYGLSDAQTALLRQTGADIRTASSAGEAVSDPAAIAALNATPENLAALDEAAVKAFTGQDGILLLWGLTPDGLETFNALTGYRHYLHELTWAVEPEFPAKISPLSGLAVYGPASETASKYKAMPFPYLFFGAGKAFRYLVSCDNLAPFATLILPDGKEQGPGHLPGNYNGFGNNESLNLNLKTEKKLTFVLPGAEEISGLNLLQSFEHVALIRQMKLTFDDGGAETVSFEPEGRGQTVRFPPHKTVRLKIEITQPQSGRTGIRELKLIMNRPDAFYETVTPLLDEGGLIFYAHGKGGILLNQIDAESRHADLTTATAVVLKNLGAQTRGLETVPLAREKDAVRILIKASSFGQPAMGVAAAMLATHCPETTFEFVTANHGDEDKGIQRNSLIQLIENGNFDAVMYVMGAGMKLERLHALQSGKPFDPVKDGYDRFAFESIKKSGAVPLLYSTWLHEREYWDLYGGNRPAEYPDLAAHLKYCATCKNVIQLEEKGACALPELRGYYRQDYEGIAAARGGKIFRTSDSFGLSLSRRPDVDLYLPAHDRMHASKYGVYLSACGVYAFLSGKSPLELPDNRLTDKDFINGSSDPDAKPEILRHLQQCAWESVQQLKKENGLYNWNIREVIQ